MAAAGPAGWPAALSRGRPALLPALGPGGLIDHPQERADGGVVLFRRLEVDVVTRRWDQDQPRAGDRRVQRLGDLPRRTYVLGAVDQQGRDGDRRQHREGRRWRMRSAWT